MEPGKQTRQESLTRALEQATQLALKGPLSGGNPRVGCVLVGEDGGVLAAGYHRGAGTAHAEVDALRALPEAALARGATAVVTLEPCAHTGRTGPCVEALVRAGVGEVVYAAPDPSARAGGGAKRLRQAGIRAISAREAGLVPEAVESACAVTARWRAVVTRRRPWVIAKSAMSADGLVAARDGSSRWITGACARAHAHRVRAGVDAIMVGTGTVLADNPSLSARAADGRTLLPHQPLPIVLGKTALPPACQLARRPHLWLRTHSISRALECAWHHGFYRVLIEGGPRLVTGAFAVGLVDEWHCYSAPLLLGQGTRALGPLGVQTLAAGLALHVESTERLGEDCLTVYTTRPGQGANQGEDTCSRD